MAHASNIETEWKEEGGRAGEGKEEGPQTSHDIFIKAYLFEILVNFFISHRGKMLEVANLEARSGRAAGQALHCKASVALTLNIIVSIRSGFI